MTIDDVMRGPVVELELASNYYDEAVEDSCRDVDKARADLRAAILALLDAEAEACAALCVDECNRAMGQYTLKEKDPTQRAIYGAMGVAATNCRDAIRARIDARKGGKDD